MHIHAQTDVELLLSSAMRNFSAVAAEQGLTGWTGMLWLAEMSGQNWFKTFSQPGPASRFRSWQVTGVGPSALIAESAGVHSCLYLVAGSQVVTAERLEVLALGTPMRFEEGRPLDHTIKAAQDAGALVVLPWGVGKWLGPRGQLVSSALTTRRESGILAGDNAGRPAFWAEPHVFRTVRARGLPVLPGTDPLPISGEERRVGANGFWLRGRLREPVDGAALRDMVLEAGADGVNCFGRRETPWRFVRNQLALRARKT